TLSIEKLRIPPNSAIFPYTTLFRSRGGVFPNCCPLSPISPRDSECGSLRWVGCGREIAYRVVEGHLSSSGRVMKRLLFASLALRSEEHTSELQSLAYLVCRLLLEKK